MGGGFWFFAVLLEGIFPWFSGFPLFSSSQKAVFGLFELIINTALVLGKVTSTFESVKLAIYKANTNPAQC